MLCHTAMTTRAAPLLHGAGTRDQGGAGGAGWSQHHPERLARPGPVPRLAASDTGDRAAESNRRGRFPAASDTSDRRRKREQMSTLRFSTGSSLYTAEVTTLTISVDSEVLRRARIRALERGESVDKYLGDVLERYAGTTSRETIDSLLSLAEEPRASSGDGERGWTREDLYDSQSFPRRH